MTLRAESAILDSGCGSLGALEKHLLGIFIRRVEEPAQSLVPRRVELPQGESPLLTWEDQADEHNLDYVDKFELLVPPSFDPDPIRGSPPGRRRACRGARKES